MWKAEGEFGTRGEDARERGGGQGGSEKDGRDDSDGRKQERENDAFPLVSPKVGGLNDSGAI